VVKLRSPLRREGTYEGERNRDQVDTNTESISAHMRKALPDDFGRGLLSWSIYPSYILVFQEIFTTLNE